MQLLLRDQIKIDIGPFDGPVTRGPTKFIHGQGQRSITPTAHRTIKAHNEPIKSWMIDIHAFSRQLLSSR
jgi:hypothetical protein